jgi:hypothetical protein
VFAFGEAGDLVPGSCVYQRDPACERFRRLSEQRWRCRAKQQKASGAAVSIDLRAQCGEDFRSALHFIKHDEPLAVLTEKKRGVGKPRAVFFGLKIQIERGGRFCGDGPRQGGFADLARAQQSDGRCAL